MADWFTKALGEAIAARMELASQVGYLRGTIRVAAADLRGGKDGQTVAEALEAALAANTKKEEGENG